MCLCKILAHFYVELSGLFLFFSMKIYKHEVQPFVGCHVTLWAVPTYPKLNSWPYSLSQLFPESCHLNI